MAFHAPAAVQSRLLAKGIASSAVSSRALYHNRLKLKFRLGSQVEIFGLPSNLAKLLWSYKEDAKNQCNKSLFQDKSEAAPKKAMASS